MNQNQETEAEWKIPEENPPDTLPGTGGPGVPWPATPELIPQTPEQTLLPPALEPERPGSPTHQQETNNGNAARPDLELRATINKNSEPTEEATHREAVLESPQPT